MKRYLDPKNDLVFKRIFGEHPNLLKSFLNAVLPLQPQEKIVSLVYLPGEQVPEIPLLKNTLVDVRCRDESGRQFIVEMQMQWTNAFMQRVLFSASRAYVRQLDKGENYDLLQPVIGLSLLDDTFDHESDAFLHHYKMVNVANTERQIVGLQLVFVELPKFHSTGSNGAQELWLRFLNETGEKDAAPEDLRGTSKEIDEALTLAEEAAFTPNELLWYDKFWDAVSRERTLISGKLRQGLTQGRAEGREQGREEGREEGRAEGLVLGRAEGLEVGKSKGLEEALARLIQNGMNESEARRLLGLSLK